MNYLHPKGKDLAALLVKHLKLAAPGPGIEGFFGLKLLAWVRAFEDLEMNCASIPSSLILVQDVAGISIKGYLPLF